MKKKRKPAKRKPKNSNCSNGHKMTIALILKSQSILQRVAVLLAARETVAALSDQQKGRSICQLNNDAWFF